MSSLWPTDTLPKKAGGEEASGAGFELLERLNGRRNSSCSRVGSASTGPRNAAQWRSGSHERQRLVDNDLQRADFSSH